MGARAATLYVSRPGEALGHRVHVGGAVARVGQGT